MHSFLTILPLCLVLAPTLARADRSVTLFPALGRPTLVTVTGRALKTTPENHGSALSKNVHRLTARSWEGAPVKVTFRDQVRQAVSGNEGLFEVSFPAPAHAAFPVGSLPVTAVAGKDAEAVTVEGSVQVISDAAPFLVISDFDDTVAVTNVRSKRGLVASALLADEETQPVVEGMPALYRCLRDGSAPTPGFAFVSGSPLEFGPRLSAFLDKHAFPAAALHLRDLGPGTLSGYKEPKLRALLSRFPHPVVLFGDSGEHDPEIYAALREEFPGRVAAIFIRDAGGETGPARLKQMVLFSSAAQAAREAAAKGLMRADCPVEPKAAPKPAPTPAPPAK